MIQFRRIKMEQDRAIRSWLDQRYSDLNVGWSPEIDKLSNAELWDMVDELENAQKKGELDLETEQGLTNLQEIVAPYFEREEQNV